MEPSDREPAPHRNLEGALHEVSNALTVILGWVVQARAPNVDPADVGVALRVVEQRARVARDLARRAIGADVPLSVDVSIDALLFQVSESLRVEFGREGHVLACKGSVGDARVSPADDVMQILTNLTLNALSHAPAGSEITLETRLGLRTAEFRIGDRGPGVPADRREKVFEGDSRRTGGAGVGLRHARAMARAVGGELLVEPSPVGAVFVLTWPLLTPTRTSAAPAASLTLDGERVLVVEDDEDVRILLDSALTLRGAEVAFASTFSELDRRLNVPHDAILVDLSPISSDITGAMDQLRTRAPNASVVFITGSLDKLPEDLAVSACVRKPFEVSEVVAALLEAKKKRQARTGT